MMRHALRALVGLSVCAGLLLFPRAGAAQEAITVPDNPELGKLVKFWAVDRLLIDQSEPVELQPRLNHKVFPGAKAQPDECFFGLDKYSTLIKPDGTCPEGGQPRTNQAYVWGLAKSEGYLYFGTIANTHCLVEDGYLGQTDPMVTNYWTCAFASKANTIDVTRPDGTHTLIPYNSDWRPPRLFRYKLPSGPIEELSGQANVPNPANELDATLSTTTGIRSAGAFNGVVFFAGPALRPVSAPNFCALHPEFCVGTNKDQVVGISVFAFNGATGKLIAKARLPQYDDIRQWLVHQNVLYTTVGTPAGGEVLRWSGDLANPLKFDEVGDLDGAGAYLVVHKGRMYISTWPRGRFAGIVRGPVIPSGGLTSANKPAAQWEKIWDVGMYDPDRVVALTTGGGALASYKGGLYWGTMHVPFLGPTAAMGAYCPDPTNKDTCKLDQAGDGFDNGDFLATALGGHRSIAIFRSMYPELLPKVGTTAQLPGYVKVEILYGEYFLPKFDAAKRSYTIAYDAAHMNVARQMPKFGASGLGNFWNAYTWTMSVFNGSLYIGTFDWSELVRVGLETALGETPSLTPATFPALQKLLGSNFPIIEGADVFRIDTTSGHAKGETYNGFGNFTNYGMRTVLVDEAANHMYIGSANPMNLHPFGGWELIDTTPKR